MVYLRLDHVFLEQNPYAKWRESQNYRAKLGVDQETFGVILNLTSKELESIHGTKTRRGNKQLLSKENLLALLLNWIFEYPSMRALSADFQVPEPTVVYYLPLLVDIVHDQLRKFAQPPPRIQRKISRGHLSGACLFVDSFPIPLSSRPDFEQKESEDRSKYYWYAGGRTSKWAIKLQTTLGLDGKIWDSSKAVPYAVSDQQLFKESVVPTILNRDSTLRGIGDLHYAKQEQFISKIRNPNQNWKKLEIELSKK